MGNGMEKPETTKYTDKCEGNGMACGVASMQGWRGEMEVRGNDFTVLCFGWVRKRPSFNQASLFSSVLHGCPSGEACIFVRVPLG
jgi:hypothetical protein